MPGLGGRARPCARLGLACVAPRGPVFGPFAARGARRGLGWLAPAWLRSGVAAVSRRSLSRSVRLSAAAAVRAARRRAAARAWRSSWVCPFCGSSSCLPVVSSCGAVFASPSCPGDLGGDSGRPLLARTLALPGGCAAPSGALAEPCRLSARAPALASEPEAAAATPPPGQPRNGAEGESSSMSTAGCPIPTSRVGTSSASLARR